VTLSMQRTKLALLVLVLLALCGCTAGQQAEAPEVSYDGLHLAKNTEYQLVYVKPGAKLSQYDRIVILDCFVSFKKNWRRDLNNSRISEQPVTKKDMDKIRTLLADEFKRVFTQALESKGGYQVVDEGAEDVLIIRPAIINLDVTEPGILSPGMTRSFVADPGEMTLYIELYDSATSEILARATDRKRGRQQGSIRVASKIMNKKAADQILRKWADILRQKLDQAHQEAAKGQK